MGSSLDYKLVHHGTAYVAGNAEARCGGLWEALLKPTEAGDFLHALPGPGNLSELGQANPTVPSVCPVSLFMFPEPKAECCPLLSYYFLFF